MVIFQSTAVGTGSTQRRIVVDADSLYPHRDVCAYLAEKATNQPTTADTYASRLPPFLTWQSSHGLDYLDAAKQFGRFQAHLRTVPIEREGRSKGRVRSFQQCNNILAATRDLYDYLVNEGLVPRVALDYLWEYHDKNDHSVRKPRHHFSEPRPGRPSIPHDSEAVKVFDAVLEENSPRNLFVFTLFSHLPLRMGSVAGLRRPDVHAVFNASDYGLVEPWYAYQGREVLCRSRKPHLHLVKRYDNPNRARVKSGDGQVLPMTDLMLLAYDEYMAQRFDLAPDAEDNDMLLVVLGDPSRRGDALGMQAIRRMVRRWGRKAGIPDLHPHALRHLWASSAIDEGASIETVQEMLGHRHKETTLATYVHVSEEKKGQAAAQRARFMTGGRA